MCSAAQCVLLCATPWTRARRAPLFMGFSQHKYWSGLPFPPPEDLPDPGIKRGSPALQVDSLPNELQGKPKNTGVSRLSLLQLIFLTQESNGGLLHCRWILYQLSYQGKKVSFKFQNKTKQSATYKDMFNVTK